MNNLSLIAEPVTQLRQKLAGRLMLCNFINLTEQDFRKYIVKLEQDGIFKKLVSSKVIQFKRFPKTGWSSRFIELDEKIISDKSAPDIGTLLEEKGRVIQLIRNVGIERFKEYFLYNDQNLTINRIARYCDLSVAEVKDINDLLDKVEITAEFYQSPTVTPENQIHYSKIAAIVRNNDDGFNIDYFSTHQAKGRYSIDYEKLKLLRQNGVKDHKELEKIDKLLKKLELVNIRKTILWQILDKIVAVQNKYLCSGEYSDFIPFTQKELADKISITPSIICRTIQYKTVIMPWGEEKKLKDLLPNKKELTKYKLKSLIEGERRPSSDTDLQNRLNHDFGILISRRSISEYRKELGIFCSFRRNC